MEGEHMTLGGEAGRMLHTDRVCRFDESKQPARLFGRLPPALLLLAGLASLLHVVPYIRAEMQTPPGWTFTGNLRASPDFMQYRVWMRQTQIDGPLVANTLTSEPNPRHLPVVFYWAVGTLARATGLAPEWTFAVVGAVLASVLIVLLFATVRLFLGGGARASWVFGAIVLGGGLGGHLKLASRILRPPSSEAVRLSFLGGGPSWLLFDDYRGHYIASTVFDTHFLFLWIVFTSAVLALYFTLRQFSAPRLLLTAALFAGATVLHVYGGVTLIAIAASVALLCSLKRVAARPALLSLVVCGTAVAIVYGGLWLLFRSSGLPMPPWRALNILVSVLFIAYPLAWIFLAWGLLDYWRGAGLEECFLLGWSLGCTVVTLSGPFYPYPDRGTLTLLIPISIVAGAVYFRKFGRVTAVSAALALLVMAASPAWALYAMWNVSRFDPGRPSVFASDDHRLIIDALHSRATRDDILLTETPDVAWLAPEYPGRLYCGHFFLTVEYERKCTQVAQLFTSPTEERATFLRSASPRFVYVDRTHDQSGIEQVAGLTVVVRTSIGTLYEREPSAATP